MRVFEPALIEFDGQEEQQDKDLDAVLTFTDVSDDFTPSVHLCNLSTGVELATITGAQALIDEKPAQDGQLDPLKRNFLFLADPIYNDVLKEADPKAIMRDYTGPYLDDLRERITPVLDQQGAYAQACTCEIDISGSDAQQRFDLTISTKSDLVQAFSQ